MKFHSRDNATQRTVLFAAASTTLLLELLAPPAVAQQSATNVIEEIIVTSRKLEENLQKAPIAVTAVTAEAIEERNMVDVLDIGAAAPNVIIQQNGATQGASNNPAIFIRGVGQSDLTQTTIPAVGTYVDGVYLAANIGNVLDLLDLKRVEVLRGPQGTLFGRNTIGGAINLISREPLPEFAGKLEAGFGEDSLYRGRVVLNLPISDQVLTRFSAMAKHQDGYIKLRNYPGRANGDVDTVALRGQVRLLPSEDLTIDVAVDYSKSEGSGAPVFLRGVNANAPNAAVYNRFFSGSPDCLTPAGQATNPVCWGPVQLQDLNDPLVSNSLYLTGSSLPLQQVGPGDVSETRGVNLTADWDLGFASLKSITAYREQSDVFRSAPAGFLFFHTNNTDVDREGFSQELQLSGAAIDDRLTWLGGAYYFEETSGNVANVIAVLTRGSPNFPVLTAGRRDLDNDNLAFFGQANFDMTERLHLTTGLRWTQDRSTLKSQQPDISGEQNSEVWTSLVTLSADLTDDALAYVTYSRGYRSGGFPGRVQGGLQSIPTFDPEFVNSYEVGAKTIFLDRRLSINTAIFMMDYSDVQAAGTNTDFNPPVPSIINAGDATLRGAELEVVAVPSAYLRLDASVGYLENELDSINPTAVDDGVFVTLDKKLPYTPKWKLAAGATLSVPIAANGGRLVSRVDWSHVDSHFFSIGNFDVAGEDGYQVLNASVAYYFADDRWKAEIVGKNLTDERYFTGGLQGYSFVGQAIGILARPRYVFGQMSYSF